MSGLVIGCTGRQRCGKTSIADIIEDTIGLISAQRSVCIPVKRVSFADPLKNLLAQFIGRTDPFRGNDKQRNTPIPEIAWADLAVSLQDKIEKRYPEFLHSPSPTGRQLLQIVGSEVFRDELAPTTWLRMAASTVSNALAVCVLDDVRFPEESRKAGDGTGFLDFLIKVNRPGVPTSNHASETGVDLIPAERIDVVIDNSGTLAELAATVGAWFTTTVVPAHPELFGVKACHEQH
jgi:hypothetical protein